jgi:hypothetical protein
MVTTLVCCVFLCLGFMFGLFEPMEAVFLEHHFFMVVHCCCLFVFVLGNLISVGTLYLQCLVLVLLS